MYHLPPHAFACLTGQHCVFLDLRRDRYFSVSRRQMEELAPWIRNFRLTSGAPGPEAQPSDAATTLASELLAADVLREGPPTPWGMENTACTAERDLDSMRTAEQDQKLRGRIWRIVASLVYADCALRIFPIERIVNAVCKRKCSRSLAGPMDWDKAAYLTTIFLKYRSLFPRDYLCLFDSLALIRFLWHYDLYPDWVFGVQGEPFCAHCWVQAESIVLNDHLDNVADYTPIMTV